MTYSFPANSLQYSTLFKFLNHSVILTSLSYFSAISLPVECCFMLHEPIPRLQQYLGSQHAPAVNVSRSWPFLLTNQPRWAGTAVLHSSTGHSSLCFPPIAFFYELVIYMASKSISLLHSQSTDKRAIWKWVCIACSLQTVCFPLIQLATKPRKMLLSLWTH